MSSTSLKSQEETDLPAALLTGTRSHVHLRDTLEQIAPGWLSARFAESEIIVALPGFHESCGLVWRAALPPTLSPLEEAAETELSQFCKLQGMLGVSRLGFANYQFPKPRNAPSSALPFSPTMMESMKKLGWENRGIRLARCASETGDDFRHRVAGAAGWLICCREFCDQRDKLLTLWEGLPEQTRPPLPLMRAARLETAPTGTRRLRASGLTEFWQHFNSFCDKWRLLGMVTWDLPNTDGPKWTEDYPGCPQAVADVDCFDTPWHFAVEGKDGLGDLLAQRHRARAEQHGFSDQPRWETYAHLLQIDFWERTIRSRYADRERPRAEVTRITAVLSELTGCDNERVKKLRSVLRSFQNGERSSLDGFR